jgi:hypothetical protein
MDERVSAELDKYLRTIGQYDNEYSKWQARTKKLIKRYRDDTRGQSGNETAKFNILWSNVQTLMPAVYAKLPKADVRAALATTTPWAVWPQASLNVQSTLRLSITPTSDQP